MQDQDVMPSTYQPRTHHLTLGEDLFVPVDPARFPQHTLRFRHQAQADALGLGHLEDDGWIDHFARFRPLPENLQRPLCLRYHGHQFRSYNPDLGDGRGFLFAQLQDQEGRLLDLGTKGSGTTPYSRGGDDRLTLKGAVREILATEMLEARGVATSRTFSVIETGEDLYRHDEPSPTRSAVLVRLSHSHIRYGTFQRLSYHQQNDSLLALVSYCLQHYYPHLLAGQANPLPAEESIPLFLQAVSQSAADTTAAWQLAGFVHGVLNTDNMNITGESFDYGPYRFLPRFQSNFVAAYFDHSGLYAYGRQPDAVYWNLGQLAAALATVYPGKQDDLTACLSAYETRLREALLYGLPARLGLNPKSGNIGSLRALQMAFFQWIEEGKTPFEDTFFALCGGPKYWRLQGLHPGLKSGKAFDAIKQIMAEFAPAEQIDFNHPYFAAPAPSDLLIDEIESIWEAIDKSDDWQPLEDKVAQIRQAAAAMQLKKKDAFKAP